MRLDIRRAQVPRAAILCALFGVQLVMHLNCDSLVLDDWMFFGASVYGKSLTAFLAERWMTWSSRLLIEGTLYLTTHSIWLWRLADSAMMVLMAASLARLAGGARSRLMLATASLMVTAIPFSILRSTGWQATSVNYYWPLACTLTAFIPLADALGGERTGRALCAACVLCAVFGANQEQTAAALAGGTLVLGAVLLWRTRRISPMLVAIGLIGAVQLLIHLLCPGNVIRAQESVAMVNLRDYGQFTLVDKLSVGLTSTTALLFYLFNPILLCFCTCVLFSAAAMRRRPPYLLLCALPLGYLVLVACARRMDGLVNLLNYSVYVLQLGPERILWPGQMGILFLLICLLGVMALSLYLALGHTPQAAVAVFAFALGFAARMAVCFSPTVVESGERTMLPLYGAMMLCALLCMQGARLRGRRWAVCPAVLCCMALAAINFAQSFVLAA